MWLVLLAVFAPCESWCSFRSIQLTRSLALRATIQKDIVATNTAYDVENWRKGYQNCEKEVCEQLAGSVPTDLVGTLYR